MDVVDDDGEATVASKQSELRQRTRPAIVGLIGYRLIR